MATHFIPGITPPNSHSADPYWLAFAGANLLVYENGTTAIIPSQIELAVYGLRPVRRQYLGLLDHRPCFSVELAPETPPPPGMVFQPLRQVFLRLEDSVLISLAGRASQIVDWDRNHQFCSRCGAEVISSELERVKQCPACGLSTYPRLSPSIIVAIHRHDEILLARNVRFPPGMYSVLAGFVEPGETLEETVAREVYEEVGLQVKNIRYFGSQPWPFPNSLMVGFTADHAAGDIKIDKIEIEDAHWYRVDTLPQLPPKISIARRMIDAYIETVK